MVDESQGLTGITTEVTQASPYVVPNGKRLYVLGFYGTPMISGLNDFISQNSGKPLILNSGKSFFPEDPNAICNFNGYLVDEDYFEAPQAYVSDALQSTDEMFAAMQEQINALDSLTTLFEYKFELMNRPLQESLDLGVPLEDLYAVGYNK